ncbi:MAG TPA: zinc-binding dehydrogenase [Solirubrobacteraceae bacterium]
MLALQYRPSIARYLATKAGAPSAGGALALEDIRPPAPPGPGWLPVKPRLSGICGSDQALLSGEASLYLASLTSGPFVPGHEIVGEIAGGPRKGERVVVQPALGCEARGIDPHCPECAGGLPALCRHTIDGHVSAGLQTGYCRDAGGGWSESLVAHASQLHAVPDDVSDEDAVLVEPLACALHAAAVADPQPGERVAVIGAGAIGLLTVAALRERLPSATIMCAAKHAGQEGAARRLGADHTCPPAQLHQEGARLTGARRLVGHGGRELLLGGFDRVLDCVGSGQSLQTAVTVTRARGRVVMVGMPGQLRTDLAAAWLRELELRGAYGYERDFPHAIELARTLKPGRLIDRGWPLRAFRKALQEAPRAARAGRVKTVFEI